MYATDLDGDGDMDVLGAAINADDITWWENDGEGGFTGHTIDANFSGADSVYATDLDGDGDMDVLGAAYTADDITWWENDEGENLTRHTINSYFDGAISVYATDLDGDGEVDVLGAASGADEIAYWKNNGYESFSKETVDDSFDGARSAYVADVDGDGDLDILGAAYTLDEIAWWEQGPAPLPGPTNLTATAASRTQIDLTWEDNSQNETTFHIERSPDGSTGWAEIGSVGANITSYSDIELDCDTTYHYRVRAYRAGDGHYSAYSNVDSATTQACPPPDAPTGLSATAVSRTQIDLTWDDNSHDETAFRIERSPDGSSDWAEIRSVGADITSYSDMGLDCDTTYFYRVRAYRAGDGQYSAYSNVDSDTTTACLPEYSVYLPMILRH